MQEIGGYFELADYEQGKGFLHQDGILLNTGRNALEYILRYIDEIKSVYLPYYTCEVVLEPLKKLHIPYSFYHINAKFEMVEDIQPKEREYIIANNYFGIKDAYIQELADKYGEHLIVDSAQALFFMPIPGVKMFYSTRKFVGVADGGVSYGVDSKYSLLYGEDDSSLHDSHLRIRKERGAEAGFRDFQQNEVKLDNQAIRLMCRNTRDILWHVDYGKVIVRRRANFAFLHEALKNKNCLQLPEMDSFACPMVYPYLVDNEGLRDFLIKNKIFVAKYWPNVMEWCHRDSIEYLLSTRLLPLPIDQRYQIGEMNYIIKCIDNEYQG